MRKFITYAALVAIFLLSACSDNETGTKETATISGRIVEVNSYGQPIPSFTPAEMKEAGFDYADLMNVKIGDSIYLTDIPYISSFNEMAILSLAYVDYNAKGDDYGFGMLNGDFHYYVGGNIGDTVVFTLSKKNGYKKTYDLMKSIYPTEQRANETAEQYANFRMVTTTGIAPGVLYRSSNPLNCAKNPGRYKVVDSLARTVGIKTEIDLADTPDNVNQYISTDGYASTYCPQLFKEGRTIACGMMANTFNDDFKQRLGKAIKFMIANEPPYLIHCNEGKDRCGFVSMVLEAFAGASIEELQRDYMVTMLNFYQIPDGGESYKLRQTLSINRMIWLLCNEDALNNYTAIKWDKIDLKALEPTLQKSVKEYFKSCGLTDEECTALHKILTQQP